eukprot:scaffold4850_cov213-Pinguiococcus_pyrenoidosus.AAC.20
MREAPCATRGSAVLCQAYRGQPQRCQKRENADPRCAVLSHSSKVMETTRTSLKEWASDASSCRLWRGFFCAKPRFSAKPCHTCTRAEHLGRRIDLGRHFL